MKRVLVALCIVLLVSLTACDNFSVDTEKIKTEYNTGYALGYAKGFADGIASSNKTIDISIGER